MLAFFRWWAGGWVGGRQLALLAFWWGWGGGMEGRGG